MASFIGIARIFAARMLLIIGVVRAINGKKVVHRLTSITL